MNINQNFKQLALLASLLSASVILSGCGDAQAKNDEKPKEEVIAIPVEVATSSLGDISSNYSTTAVLEAKEEAFVVPRATGIITHIFVEEGDYVEKDQVLAKLDTERYELNLARAKATLEGLEKEREKASRVYKQNLISDDSWDKLDAQYRAAKATLEIAKLDLAETSIRAPISGYIAERNGKVGNLTESFQRARMFHIVQQKELYGIVHLPEKELSRVTKNQRASLQLAALGGRSVPAYVERISPIIDSSTGTFKVTLRVPNPDNNLKAGMFSNVSLNYDKHLNAVLLPRRAILNIDDSTNVFVIEDNKAVKKSIKTGFEEGNLIEVLQGIEANQQVVVTGHHNLKDQAPVEIVNIETSAS